MIFLLEKKYIEKLLKLNKPEWNLIHKLGKYHLNVKSTERQKFVTAAQFLSIKTAEAVGYCGDNGFYDSFIEGDNNTYDLYKICSEIIKIVNNWFDVVEN